jgi:hypothetical protein
MNPLSKKEPYIIWIAAFILLGIALLINQYFTITSPFNALIAFSTYIATGFGAGIGLYSAYLIGVRNFVGKGLLFLGLSSLFSFGGYLLWDYYYFILNVEAQYPSLAEYSWVLGVPCGLIGCLFLLNIYRPRLNAQMITEAISIFFIISVLIAFIVGLPDFSEETLGAIVFNLFYMITDALWLSLAFIIIRIAAGKIFKGLFIYMIALILLATGDVLFFVRTLQETYFYGDISDIVMLLGSALTAISIYITAKTFNSNKAVIA